MDKYETVQALLIPIWRGIPTDYKSRYRRKIWQQFEDNIRSAAYTASLSHFVSNLCSRLQVSLRTVDVATLNGIVHGGRDRELLRLLREEATIVVLMVRVENEKRKAEWARTLAERAQEGEAVSAWLAEDGLFDEIADAAVESEE